MFKRILSTDESYVCHDSATRNTIQNFKPVKVCKMFDSDGTTPLQCRRFEPPTRGNAVTIVNSHDLFKTDVKSHVIAVAADRRRVFVLLLPTGRTNSPLFGITFSSLTCCEETHKIPFLRYFLCTYIVTPINLPRILNGQRCIVIARCIC